MIINLKSISGDFCVRRDSPSISVIITQIEACISKSEKVILDWSEVKVLGPSFVDEIIPGLIIKYGHDTIDKYIEFKPKLQGLLASQIQRGVKSRTQS